MSNSLARYVDGLLETVIIFSFFLVHVQYCLVPRTVPFFLFESRFRDSQTPNAMLNPPKKYQNIPTSRSVCALKAAPRRTSPRTYALCQLFNHPNKDISLAHHPSGRYRRTIRGIFFWFNSFMAICRGSVSPSRSTSTGAFMLHRTYVSQGDFKPHRFRRYRNAPNLQSSGAEHTRALVLGQVRGGRALSIGNLLLARLFHQFARISRVGVAGDNDVLPIDGRLVGIITLAALVVLETLLVDEVFGLVLLENLLMRLVVVAAR